MNLRTYIQEKIDKAKTEQLANNIKPIIAEALISEGKKKIDVDSLVKKLMKNKKFKEKAIQYLTDDDAMDSFSDALNGKKYTSLDNLSDGSKRRTVTQRLKDKKIDCAPLAYELWPDMSKDAARSWFSKKVDGRNESFNDEEISKLYNLLNNTLS